MATKDDTWQTWAGTRSDISRAVREGADAVAEWSGYPAAVTATVKYADGVREDLSGVDAVASLHRGDLLRLRQLWIEVTSDRDAYRADQEQRLKFWYDELKGRAEGGEQIGISEMGKPEEPPPLVAASVLIRIPYGGNGLSIAVTGPVRHEVSGLFARLSEILCDRQAWKRVDPDLGIAFAVVFIIPGLLLGQWLSHVLGFAGEDDNWEAPLMILFPVLGFVAGLGFHELYPNPEIVDDDQETRAERFAKMFWALVGAVVTSVVAAVVYDLVF